MGVRQEQLNAWWRGERRIAPVGTRGRVYWRKPGGGPIGVFARGTATVKMRVYRAAEGAWYDCETHGWVVVHGEVVLVELDEPRFRRLGCSGVM